jgi:hypothetical protein
MSLSQPQHSKFEFALTRSERIQLNAIALRSAVITGFIVAVCWFLIWSLVPNDEEWYWGTLLGLGVCAFVFVRKRRAILNRVESIWADAKRRHGLDAVDAEEQLNSKRAT